MLKAEGIKFEILVPEDNDVSLSERCRRANVIYDDCGQNAVLFSIHGNAGGGTGWECYTSVGKTKADEIATVLCNEAEKEFAPDGWKMRFDHCDGDPDKESQFYILKHTVCPAVLSENFFFDNEKDCRYRSNTEILLQDVKTYQTKDSLNAIKVGNLELSLAEYKKYRADDLALIKTLRAKNRDLERVTTTQMETINELRATVRDSVVYLPGDTVTTVLRCVDIVEPYFELHGCATPDGQFTGTHINRDSLLIVETVQYKRWLGFLWKTKKIKNRQIDVVSKNPATKILGVEFVTIEK